VDIVDLAKGILEFLKSSDLTVSEKLAAVSVVAEVLKVQPDTL